MFSALVLSKMSLVDAAATTRDESFKSVPVMLVIETVFKSQTYRTTIETWPTLEAITQMIERSCHQRLEMLA